MSEQQHDIIERTAFPWGDLKPVPDLFYAKDAIILPNHNRGTRYYLDTEFIDDGHTIDLISIGIVAEDGRELYLQSCEFKPENANPWVDQNVLPHLTMCYGNDQFQAYDILSSLMVHRQGKCNLYEVHNMPDACPWRSRNQIRNEVRAFIDAGRGKPEIYTWCGSYDHIALCQLFGPMMSLPEGWPHHVFDLQCELSDRGIEDRELPQQEQGLHNALEDARHIMRLWQIYGPHIPPYVS